MRTILFDAVIFDLDGTLVATERFWVVAATLGAERAFAELGLARELPSAEQWLSMVGLPLEHGFERVFGDLDPSRRAHVLARCVEAEHAALRAGGAAPMPGAFEALAELRAQGVKLGIASNCSQPYLDAMLGDLGFGARTDAARCLDSPGVHSKTDMLRDLLESFGTRSAVMVGDRAGDAEAAHANGLPHVHLASGFAPRTERVECEATLGGLGELVERLRGRARWIERVLRSVGAFGSARTLGVTGRSAAGKTLFARDAARLLEARGVPATALSLDGFLRRDAHHETLADGAADDHLARAFDLGALAAAVLAPRSQGAATHAGRWGASIAPERALVIDGPFLADPRIAVHLDALLQLEAPERTLLARIAARDGAGDALRRAQRDFLPAQRAFELRFPPAEHADLILDDSPLGG